MNFLMDTSPVGDLGRKSSGDSPVLQLNAERRSGSGDDFQLTSSSKPLSGKIEGKNYDMIMCSSYSPYYER